MAECARCGQNAEDLEIISPDVITKELVDSIDQGETDLARDGGMKVCAECMDELRGD